MYSQSQSIYTTSQQHGVHEQGKKVKKRNTGKPPKIYEVIKDTKKGSTHGVYSRDEPSKKLLSDALRAEEDLLITHILHPVNMGGLH